MGLKGLDHLLCAVVECCLIFATRCLQHLLTEWIRDVASLPHEAAWRAARAPGAPTQPRHTSSLAWFSSRATNKASQGRTSRVLQLTSRASLVAPGASEARTRGVPSASSPPPGVKRQAAPRRTSRPRGPRTCPEAPTRFRAQLRCTPRRQLQLLPEAARPQPAPRRPPGPRPKAATASAHRTLTLATSVMARATCPCAASTRARLPGSRGTVTPEPGQPRPGLHIAHNVELGDVKQAP